jgi:hypothetical protein
VKILPEPVLELLRVRRRLCGGDSHQIEAER